MSCLCNFITIEGLSNTHRPHFQTQHHLMLQKIATLEKHWQGKPLDHAKKGFEDHGFQTITRETDTFTLSPSFHPQKVYLYHKNQLLKNVYYL
jgi:hypothetical protein